MAVSKADMMATARYKKKHVHRISFEVQNKYWDEELQPAIEESGLSTNGFIKMCIEEYLKNRGLKTQ